MTPAYKLNLLSLVNRRLLADVPFFIQGTPWYNRPIFRVVTRMDTPKPGWTPYVVYTTEMLSFLHNRNIISNGKRSFENQINVRLDRGSLHSSYPYPLDQREPRLQTTANRF